MRARLLGLAGVLALLIGIVAFAMSDRFVMAQDDATPAASPDAAEETVPVDEDGATPAAEAASQDIVTLIAWYQPDANDELLELVPVRSTPTYVTSPGELTDQDLTGTVDFAAERNAGGQPRITLGDSIFDAYEIVDGDPDSVQRWLFFDGEDGGRPATLVMQITADRGPYEGAVGTATFISRADDSTGVLVIVLYLPTE